MLWIVADYYFTINLETYDGKRIYRFDQHGNYQHLRDALTDNPSLENSGIPCSDENPSKGHSLHRICDAVFAKIIIDEEDIEVAKIFLAFGADIDGYNSSGDDNTPLIAAASLHAEKLDVFYVG